jgi:hypothetical protein
MGLICSYPVLKATDLLSRRHTVDVVGAVMGDNGGQWEDWPVVIRVVAVGAIVVFMVFSVMGMLFCHEAFGCDRTSRALWLGIGLCGLSSSAVVALATFDQRPSWVLKWGAAVLAVTAALSLWLGIFVLSVLLAFSSLVLLLVALRCQ